MDFFLSLWSSQRTKKSNAAFALPLWVSLLFQHPDQRKSCPHIAMKQRRPFSHIWATFSFKIWAKRSLHTFNNVLKTWWNICIQEILTYFFTSCKSSCISGRLHPAVCSRLIPSYFFGIAYLTFFLFSVMFYLSPAEWLGAAIEGFASQLKFFGAGVKTLLHFCNPLITLTFDQVLCSGSRSYESNQRCFPPNRFTLMFLHNFDVYKGEEIDGAQVQSLHRLD